MSSWKESIIFHSIKFLGAWVRCLPLNIALMVGKGIGILTYYVDGKHMAQAYANLRMAFAATKSPDEIKKITKDLFRNYGQNFVELLRMPLMNTARFEELVTIEGKENIAQSLEGGKGVILLAMHFGSWEMASLATGFLGHPYKMFVNPQSKHSRLDDLLNSYRSCGGAVILSNGMGTRDFVRSLKNNEMIGMVVDQGGREGVLVPFLGRQASMSVGAIRMGVKMGVPLCFSVIVREGGGRHRMIIHPPLELEKSGDQDKDMVTNLNKVVGLMKEYIDQYPAEYMWFYKIWKYAKEVNIGIVSDGKIGHLRQSQTVAKMMKKALDERGVVANAQTAEVQYKSEFGRKIVSLSSLFYHPLIFQGRLGFLKRYLTEQSFAEVSALRADYFISCGSSTAAINFFLARDYNAKSIVLLKPGLLSFHKFDLSILPQHDAAQVKGSSANTVITHAAPNLITPEYLKTQTELLLNRFSHLKTHCRMKIGLFIGGDAKKIYLSEKQIKILIQQMEEVARELKANILVTTSRRTPARVERFLHKRLKKNPVCPLLILANQENVPEAVGGLLGLSDIVVTSGDSISMVSEAASSGKSTVVFHPETRAKVLKGVNKHKDFVEKLNEQGFVRSVDVKNVGQAIYDLVRNKAYTRSLDDNKIIFEAVKKVV